VSHASVVTLTRPIDKSSVASGLRVARIPGSPGCDRRPRVGLLARRDNGRYSLGGDVRHGFEHDRVPPAVSEADPSGLAAAAFTIVNVSTGVTFPLGDRVQARTLRVDNVGNTKYRDATSRIKTFELPDRRSIHRTRALGRHHPIRT